MNASTHSSSNSDDRAGSEEEVPDGGVLGGDNYQRMIRALSDRLVDAQRPLRILDAVKWDDEVEERFFASKCRELPVVDADYYKERPLSFDARSKKRELRKIEVDVVNQLGRLSSVGEILRRMCREYYSVVDMLEHRGRREFSRRSQELYGSTLEAFHAGEPTLADFGKVMASNLAMIGQKAFLEDEKPTITGECAIKILDENLKESFTKGGCGESVRVILDDGIVADAAAGSDYIKIRQDAMFTMRDLRLLEVHEGWVHVGTTMNGASQPVCTFLSKGPPSATVTQEGLAVLMEVFSFASHPSRLQRLTNRILAVNMAERGANFLEVFRFCQEQGLAERDSYHAAMRVFRGSTPEGKPFTKDISYLKGFVLLYNFIRFAVKRGRLDLLPLLFCGKTVLEDMRILDHLREEGILKPAKFVPPQFRDLHALTAWMCYADFLSSLNSERLETDYASFF